MLFADGYVVSAHPPLSLHSKVPRPCALDTYSTVHFNVVGFGGIAEYPKFNPLNAASVYIRSKITSAYRGERIYTLAVISATGQTLPILWHA